MVQDLSSDILNRFRSLRGSDHSPQLATTNKANANGTSLDIPELQNGENDKTVEDLLAELGPEDDWNIGQSEEDEINHLLHTAQSSLKAVPSHHDASASMAEPQLVHKEPKHDDITVPSDTNSPASYHDDELNLDHDEAQRPLNKAKLKELLDQEADETLQRILDEVKLEESASAMHDEVHTGEAPDSTSLDQDQPTTNEGMDQITKQLESSLSTLPSVPTKVPSSSPPPLSTAFPAAPRTISHTNTNTSDNDNDNGEMDTWCIICTDDATLRCLGSGCDGDLYCTKCWMEGHRGQDVEVEMQRHRAMRFEREWQDGGRKRNRREKEREFEDVVY